MRSASTANGDVEAKAQRSDAARGGPGGRTRNLVGVCLPLVLLGTASGVTCPCYLASVGYFQAKFHSDVLFGAQTAAVVVSHFATRCVEERCAANGRSMRAQVLALGVLSVVACVVMLSTPACPNKVAVLVNGALTSSLGTWLFAASIRLSMATGGSLYVNAGFSIGSLVAAVLVSVLNFGPNSPTIMAYAFYAAGAAICLLGCALWVFLSGCGGGEGAADAVEDGPEDEEAGRPAESRPLRQGQAQGYGALAGGRAGTGDTADEACDTGIAPVFSGLAASLCAPSDLGRLLCSLGLFTSLASGFALVPLFTLAGPQNAVVLHQMKCIGDFLGRVAAILHSSHCAVQGKVGAATRCSLLVTVACRLLATLEVMSWLLGAPAPRQPQLQRLAPLLVAGAFGLGNYGVFMLDLDAQLSVSEFKRRYVVQWNISVMIVGHLVGLVVGLTIVCT